MRKIFVRESGNIAVAEGPNLKGIVLTFTSPTGIDKIIEEYDASKIKAEDWQTFHKKKNRKVKDMEIFKKHLNKLYRRGDNLDEDNKRDQIDSKFHKKLSKF